MTVKCVVDPKTVHQGDDLSKACDQPGAVTPNNTVYGNCGWSSLYVSNLNYGTAGFASGAHSYLGTIEFGPALIHWENINNWWFGQIPLFVSGNYWYDWNTRYTGSGAVFADMEGDVFMSNGSICAFNWPADIDTIY